MTLFGPLPMLSETLTQIGAIALMPHEAKQEQDGIVVRPLPTATDERFVMETAAEQPNTNTETSTPDEQPDDEGNDPASTESETAVDGDGEELPTDESQPEASIDGQAEASSENHADSESEQTTDETPKE